MTMGDRWKSEQDVTLSVLVPAYNEGPTVERILDRLAQVPLKLEIVAVNDGSADDTGTHLDRLLKAGKLHKVVHHPHNRGKGAAILTAIASATGDVMVVQDADLEYDPAELPDLIRPILDGRADAVFGSRFAGGGPHRVLYFWHSLGNKMLTLMSNMMTDLNLTDMETCYKMVRSDVMKRLPLTTNRFGFEPEITARLAQAKARIFETSISYSGRTYAEGKKIGWKDGVAAIWHILRFNLFRPKI